MAAMVDPRGMAPGEGIGPGRKLASRSQFAFPCAGTAVTSCAPDGIASTGETVTAGAGVDDDPHPVTTAIASIATVIRVFTGTP